MFLNSEYIKGKCMQNNISFQGKTNLIISNARFNKNFEISKLGYHSNSCGNTRFSQGNYYNVPTQNNEILVFLKNSKKGIMRKFIPEQNIEEILLKFEDEIDKLKKFNPKEKLTAFIFGGKANDSKTIDSVNQVADVLCDRADIDASILAGNKSNVENIGMCGRIGFTNVFMPEIKGVKCEEDLEKYFDIVELNNVETIFN